jgi:hypothetical protein
MKTNISSNTPLPSSHQDGPTNATQTDWRRQFRLNGLSSHPELLMARNADSQLSPKSGHSAEADHWMLGDPATAYMVEQIVSASQESVRRQAISGMEEPALSPLDVVDALGYRAAQPPCGKARKLAFTLQLGWRAFTLLLHIACTRYSKNSGAGVSTSPLT